MRYKIEAPYKIEAYCHLQLESSHENAMAKTAISHNLRSIQAHKFNFLGIVYSQGVYVYVYPFVLSLSLILMAFFQFLLLFSFHLTKLLTLIIASIILGTLFFFLNFHDSGVAQPFSHIPGDLTCIFLEVVEQNFAGHTKGCVDSREILLSIAYKHASEKLHQKTQMYNTGDQ